MKISLFDTFKITNQLTGKAKRQRKIIQIIGSAMIPDQRTKVEISRKISTENKHSWKNSYSGVYEDVEKIFLPQKIIVEEGRIPLKRGPRLLQNEGTGFYKLTKMGSLLLFCIEEGRYKIDFAEFTDQKELGDDLNLLYSISPKLCFLLLEKYAIAWSTKEDEKEEIIPITLEKIEIIADAKLDCNLEFIKSILLCSKEDQEQVVKIIARMNPKH